MKPQTKKPIPTFGTIAWERFARCAVNAAIEDARRRKRWKSHMRFIYRGHMLMYCCTTLGRVLVNIGGRTAGGWYGELW